MEKVETYAGNKHVPVVRHPGGWALAFVHYSADPAKDEDWARKAKARGLAEDWEKEMEINFSSVHGVRCFENFSLLANTDEKIQYDPNLPLCLCCDFNVEPMCWVVAQILPNEMLVFIDEIWIESGSIPDACDEFLDKFGGHYGELRIYGDATGRNREKNQRNQSSNYDEIRMRFMRMPFRIRMKVPVKNPSNTNSVRAFNRRLSDEFGNPRIKIHPKCRHLIRDMVEVVWAEGRKEIKKERKKERGPYFWRTHAADAAMSVVNREWPTRVELSRKTEEEQRYEEKQKEKKKKRLKKKLIGAFK